MLGTKQQWQPTIHFGVFEFTPQTGELRKQGIKLRLQDQPAQILQLLLEHAGQVVSREEMQNRLWPEGTYVDFDNAINSAVRKLRDALGDQPENPRFVETLARRGYRFIAPVSYKVEEQIHLQVPIASPEALKPEAQSHLGPQRIPPQRQSKATLLRGIAVATIAVLSAVILLYRAHPNSTDGIRVSPLTSNVGLELHPSLSPDGTRIAYAWSMSPEKQSAIYVKLHGAGDAVKISKDLPRVFSPAWSPDGRWIAALQDLGQNAVIVLIPASGGQFKQVARIVTGDPSDNGCVDTAFPFICSAPSFGSALSWSPDGKYLFTSGKTEPDLPQGIICISIDTGEVRRITSPPKASAGDFGPVVSPDGQQLAFSRFRSTRTGDLYLIKLAGGNPVSGQSPKQITTDGGDVMTPAWTADGHELLFSSERDGRRALWRVSATGGSPSRVAGIGDDVLDVAVSRNKEVLVYNHGHYSGSLWKVPISGGKGGVPIRVTASTARDKYSQFSPDGRRITFQSSRSGIDEIWVCDADGTNALQLTNFGRGISGSPRWSPDGRLIAFDSNVAGSFHIHVIPSNGGRPIQLTNSPSTDAIPSWSQDNNWVYFTSWRTGRSEIWKVKASGGFETQVTKDGGSLGVESQDGSSVYFVRGGEDLGDLWRMPVNGGKATLVLRSMKGRMFTVFTKGIYFAAGLPKAELRYLDLANKSIRTVAPLPGLPHADVSADERWALYPQVAMSDTNLMMVENFR